MSANASEEAGRPLATALFAAVALIAIGALALTQELRSRPDVVNSVQIRSVAEQSAAHIRFRLTKDDDDATVAIISRDGSVVAEPLNGEPVSAGQIRLRWDGTTQAGDPAPPGRYRVRFDLGELGRRAFLPGKIRIAPGP